MNKDQLTVGNCPHCAKVIFKDGAFDSEATFFVVCPHCQKLLRVQIVRKIEVVVSPARCEDAQQFGSKYLMVVLILILPPIISFMTDAFDVMNIIT